MVNLADQIDPVDGIDEQKVTEVGQSGRSDQFDRSSWSLMENLSELRAWILRGWAIGRD